MGKASNQKMPPTHTWIWEITHTCSQKRSATKYLPHLSNVIDEHSECVAALSVDCCQYANQIYKDAQKSTESTIRKKTNNWTTERAQSFVYNAFFLCPPCLCSCYVRMSSFFLLSDTSFDCWMNCVGFMPFDHLYFRHIEVMSAILTWSI